MRIFISYSIHPRGGGICKKEINKKNMENIFIKTAIKYLELSVGVLLNFKI